MLALILLSFSLWLLYSLAPLVLWFLSTQYGDDLTRRGKYHKAYRWNRAVYRLTALPLIRSWLGKFHWVQLRALSARAEKIGDTGAAMNWMRQAAAGRFAGSERVLALAGLATLLRKDGRTVEAEATEFEALAINPSPTPSVRIRVGHISEMMKLQIARASILNGQGRFTEALAALDGLPKQEEPYFLVHTERMNALNYLGCYDEIAAEFMRANEKRREWMRRMSADADGADRIVKNKVFRAMASMFQEPECLILTRVFLEAGKIEDAAKQWDELPETMAERTRGLRFAIGAWFRAAQGRAEDSRNFARRADNTPFSDEGTKRMAKFVLARAAFALGDFGDAEERLRNLIETSAHVPLEQAEFRALLAGCLARLGREHEARVEYGRVLAARFTEAVFTHRAREERELFNSDGD